MKTAGNFIKKGDKISVGRFFFGAYADFQQNPGEAFSKQLF